MTKNNNEQRRKMKKKKNEKSHENTREFGSSITTQRFFFFLRYSLVFQLRKETQRRENKHTTKTKTKTKMGMENIHYITKMKKARRTDVFLFFKIQKRTCATVRPARRAIDSSCTGWCSIFLPIFST